MCGGDFYFGEKLVIVEKDGYVSIEFMGKDGSKKIFKLCVDLLVGEVIDGMFMSKKVLCEFFEE